MMKELLDNPNVYGTSASLRFWNELSQRMTLWSDGRINVMTAEPSTLNALWQLELSSESPNE